MTTSPENKSWSKIKAILIAPSWEGDPYAPYQIWPAASPKHRIKAKVFSNPSKILLSLSLLTLKNPIALTIWINQEAEIIGPIPNYINVPRLEAKITLVQYKGSAVCDLWIP